MDRAITACAEMHNLKEAILENQRKLESVRPAGPAQVRHREGLLLPESCSLILVGLLTGFLPTDFSWSLLLLERRGVDRGAGPAGRTDKEEWKFTFPGQVSSLQNKQDEGSGCWRGCLGPLGPRDFPDCSWLPLQIGPLLCLWGGQGLVQGAASGRAMGPGLSLRPCPYALGRGGCRDSVCAQRVEGI